MATIVNKLVRMLIGAVAASLAGTVFQKAWKLIAGEEETPRVGDPGRSFSEVVLAGLVQGAIFGLVSSILNRGGAALTGQIEED